MATIYQRKTVLRISIIIINNRHQPNILYQFPFLTQKKIRGTYLWIIFSYSMARE